MNAAYYNAEPGARSLDEMFYECSRIREEDENGEQPNSDEALTESLEELFEGSPDEFAAETSDDIDDAYDREEELDYGN